MKHILRYVRLTLITACLVLYVIICITI